MILPCPRCHGKLYASIEEEGWVCWNCGRRFYWYPTPPDQHYPLQRQTRFNRLTVQRAVVIIRVMMQSRPYPLSTEMLCRQVAAHIPGWTHTQTRELLHRRAEFTPDSRGLWVLSSDFEIE